MGQSNWWKGRYFRLASICICILTVYGGQDHCTCGWSYQAAREVTQESHAEAVIFTNFALEGFRIACRIGNYWTDVLVERASSIVF